MPKVKIQFLDLTVELEDKDSSYEDLLKSASAEITFLIKDSEVKGIINKIFAKHEDPNEDVDDSRLPPKEERMFQ